MSIDPYVVFDDLYNSRVRNRVLKIFPPDALNIGVHQTLGRGANHFHAGVILLIANLLESADPIWEIVAALAEYSWTALVIMDDLVDGQRIRRGHAALWTAESPSYAAHSAWHASTSVALAIARFERRGTFAPGDQERFLSCLGSVLAGQAARGNLRLHQSPAAFRRVMLAIAGHLGGVLSSFQAIAGQLFVATARRALRTLSYAVSLKNDIEDIFPPAPQYSPGGADLRNRQVTYAIKYLFDAMSPSEKRRISQWIEGRCFSDESFEECLIAMRRQRPAVAALRSELAAVVSKATIEMEYAFLCLPPRRQTGESADLLRAWLRSYSILGNSRIGTGDAV